MGDIHALKLLMLISFSNKTAHSIVVLSKMGSCVALPGIEKKTAGSGLRENLIPLPENG